MIKIIPYTSAWRQQFAEEKARLQKLLGDRIMAVEHIGSTAIVNCAAKPVIDILIGVNELKNIDATAIKKLENDGYIYIQRFEQQMPERRYFQKLNTNAEHTHHLHIVETNSDFWQRHLLFRDYVNLHPQQRLRYQQLKLELAKQFPDDRIAYTSGKTALITELDACAKEWDQQQRVMFTTERLQLRLFNHNDIDAFAEICADPDVMRYIAGGTHDKAMTEQRITHWIKSYNEFGYGIFAVIHKQEQRLIGFCGLINQTIEGKHYIELGYRLAKNYWGQGYASEAAAVVKQFALSELQLTQLIALIHADNTASKRVAEKQGFQLQRKITLRDLPVHVYQYPSP